MIDEAVLTERVTWAKKARQGWVCYTLLDLYEHGTPVLLRGCSDYVYALDSSCAIVDFQLNLDEDRIKQLCDKGLLEVKKIMPNGDEHYWLTELGKEVTRTLMVINEIELGAEESDTGTG